MNNINFTRLLWKFETNFPLKTNVLHQDGLLPLNSHRGVMKYFTVVLIVTPFNICLANSKSHFNNCWLSDMYDLQTFQEDQDLGMGLTHQ